MAAIDDIIVLEHNQVSPPPGSITNKTIPLSFLDIPYLLLHPIHSLYFYEFPYPNSHSINTIISNLKHSLSITLQLFYPLAGNLIVFPITDSGTIPRIPEIRFLEGDYVSFTVAECTKDFDYLTGYHARKANKFYPLVPKLGDATKEDSGNTKIPLLAIQVTLFPNRGICLGNAFHHSAMDGTASISFNKAWASISKYGGDKNFLASGSLPFLDRSVIKDTNGLGAILLSKVVETRIHESQPRHVSGNAEKVRATFIMTQDQISKLKKYVLAHRPTISTLSSFTILCAHVWICLAKLNKAVGEEDEREQFGFPADCRSRLDNPIPTSFIGNCIAGCSAMSNRDELVGEEGFIKAVELMGEAIVERSISEDSIYEVWANLFSKDYGSTPAKTIGVSGSVKFDIYGTNFGWGKMKKCETISIDYGGLTSGLIISLNTSAVSKEDIEIGLVLSKDEMVLFESIFIKELDKVLKVVLFHKSTL